MKKIIWFGPCLLSLCLAFCSKSTGNHTEEPPPAADEVTYQASAAIFPNPERGFMHTYSTKSDNSVLNAAELANLRGRNVSLILRIIYFEEFKDKAISADRLGLVRADLQKIRNAGLKAILRFAYTDDMEGQDAPLAIVEQHLDQLKPVFEENKDIIAFVQAGFIGAWGEWHSSSNGLATTENERKVLTKLLQVLPTDLMVQVRTPISKQQIFNSATPVTDQQGFGTEPIARVGHHNDCFLSNATDYGTYTDNNITAEKEYISKEALYVPTGGETCPPTGGFNPDCPEGRNQMKLLKWTYLNLDWYPATINAWKASGCFDEFQRNMGYRLVLESSNVPETTASGKSLSVAIKLINKGYAPLYHEKTTSLVLKNKATGALHSVVLPVDVRQWKPEASATISQTVDLSAVPAGDYDLYLKIADKAAGLKDNPAYAIRLANENVWIAETGMNNLLQQVKVQ